MKCEICGAKVDSTFLGKPLGAYMKDAKGKRRLICSRCQASGGAEELRKKL